MGTSKHTSIHVVNVIGGGVHDHRVYSDFKEAEKKLKQLGSIFHYMRLEPRKGACKVCYDGELQFVGISELLNNDDSFNLFNAKKEFMIGGSSYKDPL